MINHEGHTRILRSRSPIIQIYVRKVALLRSKKHKLLRTKHLDSFWDKFNDFQAVSNGES